MNNDNGLIWLCDFLILTLIGWGVGIVINSCSYETLKMAGHMSRATVIEPPSFLTGLSQAS
jgi:hypothetical protein